MLRRCQQVPHKIGGTAGLPSHGSHPERMPRGNDDRGLAALNGYCSYVQKRPQQHLACPVGCCLPVNGVKQIAICPSLWFELLRSRARSDESSDSLLVTPLEFGEQIGETNGQKTRKRVTFPEPGGDCPARSARGRCL